MKEITNEKLTFTVHEAADIIGVSSTKLYQLVRANKVPNIKLGKRYVIPKEKFIHWLDSVSVGGDL